MQGCLGQVSTPLVMEPLTRHISFDDCKILAKAFLLKSNFVVDSFFCWKSTTVSWMTEMAFKTNGRNCPQIIVAGLNYKFYSIRWLLVSGRFYTTSSNSTSKIIVAPAGITGGEPLSP